MAAILTDGTFIWVMLNANGRIPIQIALKCVPDDNNPALFHVMAWYPTGYRPLPESMMTQFTDAYMWN